MRFPEAIKAARLLVAGAMVLIGSPVSSLAFAGEAHAAQVVIAPNGNANPGDNITICHANNDNKKPYVQEAPNANGDVQGHADHTGPVWNPSLKAGQGNNTSWGDIIPPFTYNDKNGVLAGSFPGLNWDAAGQAIWENGCDVTSTLKVVKHVVNTGGGTESASDFSMTVTGQSNFPGSETGTTLTLTPGDYTVGEVADQNYTESINGDCDSDGNVTLLAGENLTCTVTNTFVPGVVIPEHNLFVIKQVVGNPSAQPSDFMIHVEDSDHMQVGQDQSGTSVAPGDEWSGLEGPYAVSESSSTQDLSDYTVTYSQNCLDGNVTIDTADETCTITNTFIAGQGGTVDDGGNGDPGQGGTPPATNPGQGSTPGGSVLGASTGPTPQVLGTATLPATGSESDLPWMVSLLGAMAAYWVSRRRLTLADEQA